MAKPEQHPRPEHKHEEASSRLSRQQAMVIATQVDLKRQAAERRARKFLIALAEREHAAPPRPA